MLHQGLDERIFLALVKVDEMLPAALRDPGQLELEQQASGESSQCHGVVP